MIFQKNELFTEISGCNSLSEIYSEKIKLDDEAIVLIYGDELIEDSAETASQLAKADFITVFASEDITRFSYRFLSQFDVRISGKEYPADLAEADERYKLLCGASAYELLRSGKTENAPNFVTVLTDEGNFSQQAQAYVSRVCGDKTRAQIKVLAGCLKAAVKGGTDAVFKAESEGFYALMAQRTEDKADE